MDEQARRRFERWQLESLAGGDTAKPGLSGKTLALLGLDADGNRAATSWTDAAKHTAGNLINAPQDIGNQLLDLQDYQPVYGTGVSNPEDRARAGQQAVSTFGLAGLAPLGGLAAGKIASRAHPVAAPEAVASKSAHIPEPQQPALTCRTVYERAFASHGLHTAQVLLTHDDLADRKRYLNARSTLSTLLRLGVVPIINENDTVITDGIKFEAIVQRPAGFGFAPAKWFFGQLVNANLTRHKSTLCRSKNSNGTFILDNPWPTGSSGGPVPPWADENVVHLFTS